MAFNGTGSNVTSLNASNISSGTVGTARLASGTADSTTFLRGDQTWSEGGGDYIMRVYTGPATWTKPTGLKAVKVTVVGGGGNGGASTNGPLTQSSQTGGSGGGGGAAIRYLDAPTIPGPVAVASGGAGATSSFGAFASATGGAAGGTGTQTVNGALGDGGTGSSGDLNMPGGPGNLRYYFVGNEATPDVTISGIAGSSIMGQGARGQATPRGAGFAGTAYGGGGSGACTAPRSSKSPFPSVAGGSGASGVVIVEEFY